MQAELSDRINEYEGLRHVAITALVVALVCMAMPFLKVTAGEIAQTFSIWQFGTSYFRYSDIGFLFPDEVGSRIIVSRIFAWLIMVLGALGLVLLFNKNKATKNADNTIRTMIFSGIALAFVFGLYFYIF